MKDWKEKAQLSVGFELFEALSYSKASITYDWNHLGFELTIMMYYCMRFTTVQQPQHTPFGP